MVMKNAKNVHFWQIDHQIKNILSAKGVIVLSSPEAWKKLSWTRKYFPQKPKEGYFVWLKKKIDFPLATCLSISSPKISQDLNNLLVIEKGIEARANVICYAQKKNLSATHKARGILVLKKDARLHYDHFHEWGQKDFVSPDYEFFLERGSHLFYNYKSLFCPKKLSLKTKIYASQNACSNLSTVIDGRDSEIDIEETVFLEGKGSQSIVRLRLVGREKVNIRALSRIVAKKKSKGHLDCQGLLLEKTGRISLAPELVCEHQKAQITHEASIGKVSEEQLAYLRMRGLTEKQAIDLIVGGFLKE